ncbi:MAG: hypothetical protein COA79_03365 [Planctomycetota bacterium]|nr:MAG: hypothetical protein COA79_03365 [Planctomycetota bacterium]
MSRLPEPIHINIDPSDFDSFRLYDRHNFFYDNYKEGNILDIGNIGGVFGKGKISKFHLQVKDKIESSSNLYGFDLYPPENPAEYNLQKTGNLEEGLPYEDSFFDTIYLGQVLEHLGNPNIALLEIKRVLKSDGIFIMDIPNPYSLARILKYLFKRKESLGNVTHLIFYTPASLKSLLYNAGFNLVKMNTRLSTKFKLIPFVFIKGLGPHICVTATKVNN